METRHERAVKTASIHDLASWLADDVDEELNLMLVVDRLPLLHMTATQKRVNKHHGDAKIRVT